jgi:hypothetical protein
MKKRKQPSPRPTHQKKRRPSSRLEVQQKKEMNISTTNESKEGLNVIMANKSENPRPQNNPHLATPLALHTTMLVKVTICKSIKGDEHHHGHKGG